jgi:hypothetical protein
MVTDMVKPKFLGKMCHNATSSTIKPTRRLSSDLGSKTPANNCVSYDIF